MKINITVTTIAIKFVDDVTSAKYHFSVDTYARLNAGTNKEFIEHFMKEYSGNGIESITVLQSDKTEMYIDTFRDLENLLHTLRKQYDSINETILDY